MPHDDARAAALTEVRFEFEIDGVDEAWPVHSAVVREALCAPFDATVTLTTPPLAAPADLLRRPCALTLHVDAVARRFAGVVTSVEDHGTDRDRRGNLVVRFAPALALLAHSTRYRIWQGGDALRVVRDVLDDHDAYATDRVQLSTIDELQAREYCTQFGESDLDFVRRLLDEEGLLFAFDADDQGELLELFDARRAPHRPAVPTQLAGAIPVTLLRSEAAADDTIYALAMCAQVTPRTVTLRDYDFTHPQAPLQHGERAAAFSVERYPARFALGAYSPSNHAYGAPDARRAGRLALQHATAAAACLRGESNVVGMRAGATFEAAEHGERAVPGPLLLTAVEHTAWRRETGRDDALAGREQRPGYANRFECVPADHTWAPPAPPRPRADHPQVAVVTAEHGSDEEIVTDHYGRVLVRFPWDRSGTSERPAERARQRTSCWLRVMQPWAGPNWGFHFTPRVGMEVVVQFVDGDPDRPYVAGCLPNAMNLPPIELPARKTQSTIRTRSTPRSQGFNELRFDDAADHEQVYLRAQRDFATEVLHDRAQSVGRDERLRVHRDQSEAVGRNRALTVDGAETHVVRKNRHVSVGEDQLVEVVGNASLIVHHTVTTHADEAWRTTASDVGSLEVGGGAGTAIQMTPDEIQVRAPKKLGIGVGEDMSAEATEDSLVVRVKKRLTLECGESRLVIEPDRIELVTKSGARVVVDGDRVDVVAGGAIKLKGSEVKTNG